MQIFRILGLLNVLLIACMATIDSAGAVNCPPLPAKGLTRQRIVDQLVNPDCDIRMMEDFLAQLPYEYMRHHALAYQSHSLQGPHRIDYLNPRAIIFGELGLISEFGPMTLPSESKMIMSFNGLPSQSQFQQIELVEVDLASDSIFNYFSIEFPKVKPSAWQPASVSQNNPTSCTKCHGAPARPIFPSYPLWPGFFGSMKLPDVATKADENAKYNEFRQYAQTHPRYKYLFKPEEQVSPYSRYDVLGKDQIGFMDQVEELGSLLSIANGERVARFMRATPNYEELKWAMLAGLLECSDWMSFLPARVGNALSANMGVLPAPEGLRDVGSQVLASGDARDLFVYSYYGVPPSGPDPRSIDEFVTLIQSQFGQNAKLLNLQLDTWTKQGPARDSIAVAPIRLLMEGRGIDMSSWFTDLAQPTYRMANGLASSEWTWIVGLVHQDPEIGALRGNLSKFWSNRANTAFASPVVSSPLCEDLKTRSLRASGKLSIAYTRPHFMLSEYPPAFTNFCASCHADARVNFAPRIPFDQPDQLRTLIRQTNLGERIWTRINAPEGDQMPPIRILSPFEREEIKRYLGR